jgi:hypothetical protein
MTFGGGNMIKKVTLLLFVSLLLASLVACSNVSSEFAGTYTCIQKSNNSDCSKGDVLELDKDGSIYAHSPGGTGMGGTWKIEGQTIYVYYDFMGFTMKGQIQGDTISFDDGAIFKK